MSPIYEVRCELCGQEYEVLTGLDNRSTSCRFCGTGTTERIPSVRGPNCSNENAGWLRSVLEVVEKDSIGKPHVAEFLRDPNRRTYKAWMKGEGLRPLEPGEKHKKEDIDISRHADKLMQMRQERNRIHIR